VWISNPGKTVIGTHEIRLFCPGVGPEWCVSLAKHEGTTPPDLPRTGMRQGVGSVFVPEPSKLSCGSSAWCLRHSRE
jgi:hypothetical protein